MTEIRLNSPRVRVVLGDPDDPGSWQEHEVQTIHKDMVMAETEMATSKRGATTEHQMLTLTIAAYMALRRTGRIQAGQVDDFVDGCLDLDVVSGGAKDPTDPTQPAAEAG